MGYEISAIIVSSSILVSSPTSWPTRSSFSFLPFTPGKIEKLLRDTGNSWVFGWTYNLHGSSYNLLNISSPRSSLISSSLSCQHTIASPSSTLLISFSPIPGLRFSSSCLTPSILYGLLDKFHSLFNVDCCIISFLYSSWSLEYKYTCFLLACFPKHPLFL